MKDKFKEFLPQVLKPWVPGSVGIPQSISTSHLVNLGNDNLPPDIMINAEGDPYNVYLTIDDVDEVMTDLGFSKEQALDPYSGFYGFWQAELI